MTSRHNPQVVLVTERTMQSESAGLHILMDARVRDASVFNRTTLEHLFTHLVTALEMKALDKLLVYEVPVDPAVLERARKTGIFEDEGGISTVQVISTSHGTLHAWPLQNYFALDVFSCKDFNAERALGIIRETLGVTSENTLVVKRRKPSSVGDSSVVHYEV